MRILLLLLFILFLRGEEFNATFFNELNSDLELNLTDNNITDETNKSVENNLTKNREVEVIDVEFPPLIEENLTDGNIVNLDEHQLKVAIILNKEKFFKINPCDDCNHHCAVNSANEMIIEYLSIDKEHLEFV